MKKTSIVILSLFIISTLLTNSILVYSVPAYENASLDSDAVTYHPQKVQVTHSQTGKLVYGYWDPSDEEINLIVYSSDGTNEALSTYSQDYQAYGDLVISDFGHSTDVFIIAISRINVQHWEARLYRYNVNTYAWDYIGEQHLSSEQERRHTRISEGFEYDSDYFWFYHSWDGDDSTGSFGWLELDPATDTYSVTTNETISEGASYSGWDSYPPVQVCQDPTYSNLFYMMTADQDDDERPTFYRFDVTGGAGDILKLGTGGSSNAFYQDSGEWLYYFQRIGQGVEDSGDLRYLYYTYSFSYHQADNSRAVQFRQHRLVFNTSGTGSIIEANLTAQNTRSLLVALNLGVSPSTLGWNLGYQEDYDNVTLYMSNYDSDQAEYMVSVIQITIDQWFTYSGYTGLQYTTSQEDYGTTIYEPRRPLQSRISRDWDSTFQSDYSGSTYDEWRVWYDLTAIERNYDITLTYSPSDDPLTTNTQYTFTATSTMNGLGLEVINVIYWDGGQIATDYSETNGVYQFTLISSYGGLHNLTIAIWDGSPPTYQYSESWVYTFSFPSTTTTPTSPTVVTTTSNLIIGGIPIILMILFPTFIFWRFSGENIFGAMIGIDLGIIICNITGYLPTYTVFLMILLNIAYVVREGV